MKLSIVFIGVIIVFDRYNCKIIPPAQNTYGSQFYGHDLLHNETILDKSSTTPENYTATFTYTDKEDQIVTFLKFQINDNNSSSTSTLRFKNKSLEATVNVFNALNVTAMAYVYGFNQKNITSVFIRRLYEEKNAKTQPLSYVLNFEYMQNEEESL